MSSEHKQASMQAHETESSRCDFSKFEAEDTATSFVSLKIELGINPSRAVDWSR